MKSRMLGLENHQILRIGRKQSSDLATLASQTLAGGKNVAELAVPSALVVVGVDRSHALFTKPGLEPDNAPGSPYRFLQQRSGIGKLKRVDDIHQQQHLRAVRHLRGF
ncbi:hypothetical protein MI467_03430 [Delftia acidovorans]|uniref:hypothetical protein n=1 Tax=Delftia acidovorans TaxID=80866 RepID=UPI001EFE7660|nr:hypothetical protein [Delftia acidovorans]MCG8985889.1 hypothetical protein [Delftia acidovorans]